VWFVPPEDLMEDVRTSGLDAHAGLRGIGYATRMLLPLFVTCDTLDFSHTVGSANSPWNAVFVYERYPHGLGFTERAYERLHEILPRVLEQVRACPCEDGCPRCVGKPLRQYATWNVELHEGSVPSKAAARRILEGLLGDGSNLNHPDRGALSDSGPAAELRLEQALRRRLYRMREPQVFHPIEPKPETGYPAAEPADELANADVTRRMVRRRSFHRELRRRIGKHVPPDGLDSHAARHRPPPGTRQPGGVRTPADFAGRPEQAGNPLRAGDPLAAKALRKTKGKK
jgi:hypothetical protein